MEVFQVIVDSSLSGAPRHVLTLAMALKKFKCDCKIVCPKGWLSSEAEKQRLKAIVVPISGAFDLKAARELHKIIKSYKPEIVHFHGIRAGGVGLLANLPKYIKTVYTEHLFTREYHLKNHWREATQRILLSRIAKKSDKIIAVSLAVKNFLVGSLKIDSAKISVISNGLADYTINNRVRSSRTLGFIGSLNEQKGLPELVKAFEQVLKTVPDAKLEIIGAGPLRDEIENLAKPFGGAVRFVGQVKFISDYLCRWAAVVVPSRSESFGQVALDAAIASRPVIASRVGGLTEVVQDGKTGILVEFGDVQALRAAMIEILNDSEAANKMGKTARKLYERKFTDTLMAKKIMKNYEDIR